MILVWSVFMTAVSTKSAGGRPRRHARRAGSIWTAPGSRSPVATDRPVERCWVVAEIKSTDCRGLAKPDSKGSMENQNPFAPLVDAIADAVLARLRPALDVHIRPRLLSIDQAGIYLGRTPKAVRCLIDKGEFPSVRPDGRIMLDVHDLDAWIDQNKREP
jgi:hypothetical protein